MLLDYQNEIIALIVLLMLLIIYLLIKLNKKTVTNTTKTDEIIKTVESVNTQEIIETNEIKENTAENLENFEGSVAGDFISPVTESSQKKQRKSDIIKRDIKKHGKITKQDFKEFKGVRILVAEDNIINQKVISGLLAGSGIELVMANDGQEVLEILEKDSNFLIILMDAHMPRIDGFEATRTIRANPNYEHIVVVALSGDTAVDDVRKMTESGMAEHLEKPLRMDSLYDVLYAYSGPRETQKVQTSIIEELNTTKGIAICGGDEGFYLEILHEFVETYADSAHTLRKLLTSSQESAADKLLLDIIGVSANIGADEFTKVANEFKETLSDTQEKTYFTNLEQYQSHLKYLIKDIQNFINR